ncbi:MAG: Ig-like domain-containing protein, partial [Kaistella sp.]
FDFESDKIENYGTLVVTLENAPEQMLWLQLLSESGNVAYSRYSKERSITFASLKPGKYQLRILVDNNENGIWDAADFAAGEFAEDIYVFEKTIEIRPFWEIREKWNVLPVAGETVSEAETAPENLQKPAVKELPAKP